MSIMPYICVYIYIYVCIHGHVCIYIYMCICIYIYIHIWIYMCVCKCICSPGGLSICLGVWHLVLFTWGVNVYVHLGCWRCNYLHTTTPDGLCRFSPIVPASRERGTEREKEGERGRERGKDGKRKRERQGEREREGEDEWVSWYMPAPPDHPHLMWQALVIWLFVSSLSSEWNLKFYTLVTAPTPTQ